MPFGVRASQTGPEERPHLPAATQRRPMQQQPAISAVMPVDVAEPVLSATTLLAGLKSPADEAVANIMYLLGGPLVWAASLAFVISVLIQGDGRNADGSYR